MEDGWSRQGSVRAAAWALPVLAHALTLALVIPAQDFRYAYPVYMAAWLVPALMFTQPLVTRTARERGPARVA